MSYTSLVLIALVAVAAPLLLELLPGVPIPLVAVEVLAGILIGPHALGWATLNAPVDVLSSLGLASLLFLAGLEINLEALRGPLLRLTAWAFVVSVLLAFSAGQLLGLLGVVVSPLLVGVILVSTSLGIVILPLKDGGLTGTAFGQLAVTSASIAEMGGVVLLSLFFSQHGSSKASPPLHLAVFAAMVLGLALVLAQADRLEPIRRALYRLRDTSAQIRVRASFALLGVAIWLGLQLGLDAILAAFSAGVVLNWLDGEDHDLRHKLEVVGFGVFVPVFFIASGMQVAVGDLFASASSIARVPILLLAIVAVRFLPALLYAPRFGRRQAVAAGMLQSTSLSFIIVAVQLGTFLGIMRASTAAAFVAAGLISVLIFPAAALAVLRRPEPEPAPAPAADLALEQTG